MSGKSRIVRPVKSSGSTCGNQHLFCTDFIGFLFRNRKSEGSFYDIIFYDIIGNIQLVDDRYVRELTDRISKERFKVLSVNLNIPVSSGNIFAILIL